MIFLDEVEGSSTQYCPALRGRRVSTHVGALLRRAALITVVVRLPLAARAADEPKLDKEISFGVKMAQRGLWNEALFRFKRAAELRPNDGKILNNLAVAYEAVGQYENALLAYQEALKADSTNRDLKRNYSRFIEFYQAFKPAPEESQGEVGEALETSQDAEGQTDPPSSESGQ